MAETGLSPWLEDEELTETGPGLQFLQTDPPTDSPTDKTTAR